MMCSAVTCICQHAPTPYTSLIEAGQDCFPRWAEGWLEEPLFFSSSCCCTWQTSTRCSLQTARPATQPPLSLRLSLVNLRSRSHLMMNKLHSIWVISVYIHYSLWGTDLSSLLCKWEGGSDSNYFLMNIVKRCFFSEIYLQALLIIVIVFLSGESLKL